MIDAFKTNGSSPPASRSRLLQRRQARRYARESKHQRRDVWLGIFLVFSPWLVARSPQSTGTADAVTSPRDALLPNVPVQRGGQGRGAPRPSCSRIGPWLPCQRRPCRPERPSPGSNRGQPVGTAPPCSAGCRTSPLDSVNRS
jgi:hypothetical protein